MTRPFDPATPTVDRRPRRQAMRLTGGAVALLLSVSACGSTRTYDIGRLFPVSDPTKTCARYEGKLHIPGDETEYSCIVSKAECNKAFADYNAMIASSPSAFTMRYTGVCDD